MNDRSYPVDLKTLTTDERIKFIDSFDKVFFDCDGVLWHLSGKSIEGSTETIDYIRRLGKDIKFLTNNTLLTQRESVLRFESKGLSVSEDEIISPTNAVIDYLKAKGVRGLIYCIASKKFKQRLREEGFEVIDGPNRLMNEDGVEDIISSMLTGLPVKAVVMDIDVNLCIIKLLQAQHYLNDADCLFIAGGVDISQTMGNIKLIGPGQFIKLVEAATGRKATTLGKPGLALVDYLNDVCNITDPSRVLIVGDTLDVDIKFGKVGGYKTLLVLTGFSSLEDVLGDLPKDQTPNYYIDRLSSLKDFI